MRYELPIIYMNEDDFEKMVSSICRDILGMGVIEFSKGRDGGKDGRFTGKANKFPSEAKGWEGKMIIQAKHTEQVDGKCNSGEFFTQKSSVINKEIERLQVLFKDGELEYYLLFTNRKYSGGADSKIRKKISEEVGLNIDNIVIFGIENINTYLNSTEGKLITRDFKLNQYLFDFDFSEEEIKRIIIAFKNNLSDLEDDVKEEVEKLKHDYTYLDKKVKNEKNQLGKKYFENVILKNSIHHFENIDKFLADPINTKLKDMYYDVAGELNELITLKRDDFVGFEDIFRFIYKKVSADTERMLGNKKFIPTFLHYMYFNCEIGEK